MRAFKMSNPQKSEEHIIHETYLNLIANSTPLKNFLIGETQKNGTEYKLKIITCNNPEDWDLQFEDRFRQEISIRDITIGEFEVEKVSMKRFIDRAFKLEDILQKKIGCSFLDPSHVETFTKDLFTIAEELRSSDVHVYPAQKSNSLEGIIKMRVDGRLREIKKLAEKDFYKLNDYLQGRVPELVAAKDKKTLEGSFFLDGNNDTSYRLSSIQINAARSVKKDLYSTVIRILKTKDITFSLSELGYSSEDEGQIRSMIKEKSGVIAIVGRVGMGKSTTAASLVTEISKTNNEEVKIITLEDPVEYYIPSALQMRVTAKENTENELTYTEAFKNCLRQDPDVIMVGETRNEATTKHLFDLAHTGSLALTTFHAKDINKALTRLASYNLDGSTVCGSLLGIISQVLIRQNCDNCVQSRRMDIAERDYFFQRPFEKNEDYEEFIERNLLPEVAESSGILDGHTCPKCEGTGFFGRKPIVEIYVHTVANDEIIHAICNKSPDGRKKFIDLFKTGKCQPFALGALNMIFNQATSPKEIMNMLPPSYFRDYSELLIRKTNDRIKSYSSI